MRSDFVWYHKAVERAERRADRAGWFCAFILGWQVYIFLGFLTSVNHISEMAPVEMIGSLVLALLWLRMVWKIARVYLFIDRQRQQQIDIGNIYRAPVDSLANIRNVVQNFSALLFSSKYSIDFELWINRSRGLSPSVFEVGKRICLCLPLGFIVLFRTNQLCAEAILAHELSHVAQGDVILWRFSFIVDLPLYRSFSILLWCSIIMNIIVLLRSIVILDQSGFTIMMIFGIMLRLMTIILLHRMARRILSARYASEVLADLGAALCVGSEGYCLTLSRIIDDVSATSTHPARDDRVRIVRAYFQNEDQQAPIRIGNLSV